jgi:hypothetical protein
MSKRREKLVGFKYRPRGVLTAEVRKSCRDEWKILYSGAVFGEQVWARLSTLGKASVFEASKLSSNMRDLVRVHGEGIRIEGARNGELIAVFYLPPTSMRIRHRVEALIIGC